MFFQGGMLVNVIRGCHCPLLLKTIRDELDKEHKAIEGHRERVRVSCNTMITVLRINFVSDLEGK